MIAAGIHTSDGPTAGRMLSRAITTPQSTGAPIPEQRERDSADSALHDTDHDRAFDRGPRHLGESREQMSLTLVAERQRTYETFEQSRAVPQEEKQEIQHQEEEQRDADRVLPDRQGARRDETAHGHRGRRHLAFESRGVDAESLERGDDKRKTRLRFRDQPLELYASRVEPLNEPSRLARHSRGDAHER